MNQDQITKAWNQAKAIYGAMPSNDRPSVDAIFVACATGGRAKRKYAMLQKDAPDAFVKSVKNLEWRRCTAGELYALINNGQAPTPIQAKQYGQWLRSLGYESKKSNGRVIFTINN